MKSLRPIRLGNPYHDEKGRFSSKGGLFLPSYGFREFKAINTAANVGTAAGVVGVIGGAFTQAIAERKIRENKGRDRTVFKVGKREITLQGIRKGGQKVTRVGLATVWGSFGLWLGNLVGALVMAKHNPTWAEKFMRDASSAGFGPSSYHGSSDYEERVKQARARAEEEWARRNSRNSSYTSPNNMRSSWPKEATHEDFKRMYRKLAKSFHPDVGKFRSEESMKKINEAYGKEDWHGLKNIYDAANEQNMLRHRTFTVKLEDDTELPIFEDFMGMTLAIVRAYAQGDDYVTIPSPPELEEVLKANDFVIEDGNLILDRTAMEIIIAGCLAQIGE